MDVNVGRNGYYVTKTVNKVLLDERTLFEHSQNMKILIALICMHYTGVVIWNNNVQGLYKFRVQLLLITVLVLQRRNDADLL